MPSEKLISGTGIIELSGDQWNSTGSKQNILFTH